MQSRILITGSTGLIGSSVLRKLENLDNFEILSPTRKELDLTNSNEVEKFFSKNKPQIVINLAAKVGGILANATKPVDFFEENLLIEFNTYRYSRIYGVERIINAGAGCGYPLTAKEPLLESTIWDGLAQSESIAYSTVKKLLTLMGEIYETQGGIKSVTVIPSNVYGTHDNFNLQEGHVVPALINRIYQAKINRQDSVEVWGSGEAKRDFIFVEDVSSVIINLLKNEFKGVLNVATGKQTTIKDLAETISDLLEFDGKLIWDLSKPAGQSSRLMSTSKIGELFKNWNPTTLDEGLRKTIKWFTSSYSSGKVRL